MSLTHWAILLAFAVITGFCLYLDLTDTQDEEFPIL